MERCDERMSYCNCLSGFFLKEIMGFLSGGLLRGLLRGRCWTAACGARAEASCRSHVRCFLVLGMSINNVMLVSPPPPMSNVLI